MDVRGRNLITGLPATVTVSSTEMLEALEEPVAQIFEAVHSVLERTPPELMADISQRGEIVEAYAYAIDRGDSKQQQFQQILRNLGFIVKLKPYIQRSDGSAKGDWDVGITLDVIEAAARVDEIVLASGDGDFDQLLERARLRFADTDVCVFNVEPAANPPDFCADRRITPSTSGRSRGCPAARITPVVGIQRSFTTPSGTRSK